MGRKRDLKELEQHRLRGARLLRRGYTQAEVAWACEVSRNAVSLWAKQMAAGSRSALKCRALGRPAALGAEGRDPGHSVPLHWKQLSVMTGISQVRFCFRLFPGAIKSEQTVISQGLARDRRCQAADRLGGARRPPQSRWVRAS